MLWFVAFGDETQEGDNWWNDPKHEGKWTRPGFQHCIAYRQLRPGLVLIVEPLRRHMVIDVVDGWAYKANDAMLEDGYTVVAFDAPEAPPEVLNGVRHRRLDWSSMMTCASVVSYMLFLNERPLGPWQLYNALLDRGARHWVKEDLPHGRRHGRDLGSLQGNRGGRRRDAPEAVSGGQGREADRPPGGDARAAAHGEP